MILVDTSIWIQILGRKPPKNYRPEILLEVFLCPVILQEVLQGIRDERAYSEVRDRMLALPMLEQSTNLDCYLRGAEIFRLGLRKGFTIRSSTDCLIAAIAIKHNVPIWHADRDYNAIAKFTSLEIY